MDCSKREADASHEHRYYKRVTDSAATICWGVALAVSLSLPVASQVTTQSGPPVPLPGAPASIGAPPRAPGATPPSTQKEAPPPPPPPYEVAWSASINANAPVTIALNASSVIVAGSDSPIQAYDLEDGKVRWTSPSGSDVTPAVAEGFVVGVAGSRLTALSDATGELRWSQPLGVESRRPVIQNGRVLITTGTELHAYRLADGARLWAVSLGVRPITDVAASDAAAVIALEDKTIAAYELGAGRLVWRTPIEITPMGLVLTADRIYFGTPDNLACSFRMANGQYDWCFDVRVRPVGEPLVHDRFVYFAFLDSTLRVFNRGSGARLQSVTLNARPAGGPKLAGDHIAIPIVTADFNLVKMPDHTANVRVSGPASPESPPTLQTSAAAPDGSILAMVTVSTARTALVCLKKRAVEEKKDK